MLVIRPSVALRTPATRSCSARLICRRQLQNSIRCLVTASSKPQRYDAVVVGAGPGGLTCVTNLLDQGLQNICMVDPSFTAGRINEKYREVPSNTKTMMFEKWATGTKVADQILKSAPTPNAYQKLLTFDQDAGCPLGDAIDVAQLLSDGLRNDPRIHSIKARVEALNKLDDDTWRIPELDLITDRIVLAVGSHPKPHDLVSHYPHIQALELDTCLKPSALSKAVPAGSKVAVVGASHSAILAIKNLYELGNVDVINFHRSPLLYAIYKEGWILYDNTGLKGIAANWAREVLGADSLPQSLRRINMKSDENKDKTEKEIYDKELQGVTHLVSAIGYEMNQLPTIKVNGTAVTPEFDPLSGRFYKARGDKAVLGGLFGAGIAYPERVTDPAGNIESAVGWFKFMKFVKRTSPEWVQNP